MEISFLSAFSQSANQAKPSQAINKKSSKRKKRKEKMRGGPRK
jgi:hypothetical protein